MYTKHIMHMIKTRKLLLGVLDIHCYNRDFQDLAVLPPWNTLWAQIIQRGDPPVIVTENITVTYSFPDNTNSVGNQTSGITPTCCST